MFSKATIKTNFFSIQINIKTIIVIYGTKLESDLMMLLCVRHHRHLTNKFEKRKQVVTGLDLG